MWKSWKFINLLDFTQPSFAIVKELALYSYATKLFEFL
jgi:hypothetical protein